MHFAWNWLSLPYLVCAASLAAVSLVAALVRGDRVLRLGTIGAATTALPWAMCSAVATWTDDPAIAERLLRLGNGPIALVGPSLLLLLLGVSGQLERHRYLARIAGALGIIFLALCWGTDWVVRGVHLLPSKIYYPSAGPLTALHFSQIGIWLVIGMVIVRRATTGGERRRLERMLLAVLALGTIGATDLLLVYDIAGVYPIAWLCATVAALVGLRYEIETDLLRPQGFDRAAFVETLGTLLAVVIVGVVTIVVDGLSALQIAALGTVLWIVVLGVTWALVRDQPVRIARERALEMLVAELADVTTEAEVATRLAALWNDIGIAITRVDRVDEHLVDVATGTRRVLDGEVARWLVSHGELLAAGDLGTMRVGPIRPMLEQIISSPTLIIVPLIDRGALVGLVEADYGAALREAERGLVVESARAAARAFTYVALARAAALEGETAREVEVAEAMRLQAAASRNDELGPWAVAAEYRSAPRTTGAGWSASLLHDGRLALLVTEAQAHGVAAALATAALTGAFVAATSIGEVTLESLLASLNASAEGVLRGGEPVGAFVALMDGDTERIEWAAAGHPGATILGHETVTLGGGESQASTSLVVARRGDTALSADAVLVVASSSVQAAIAATALAEHGPGRYAGALVDQALRSGAPQEDLLAVVVRQRRQ